MVNNGNVTNTNSISSRITNNTNGTFNNSSSLTGNIENNGNLTNSGTISGDELVNNNTVNNTGRISSDITNNSGGTLTNTGTVTGSLENNGVFVSSASGLQSPDINNDGTIYLNAGSDGSENNFNPDITVIGNGTFNITNGNITISNDNFTQNKIATNSGAVTNINSDITVDEVNNNGTTNINTKITANTIQSEAGTINIQSGNDSKLSEKIGNSNIIIYDGAKVTANTSSDKYTVDKNVSGVDTTASENSKFELNGSNNTKFDIDAQINDTTIAVINGQLYLPNENNLNNSNVQISSGAELNTLDGNTETYHNTIFDDGAKLKIDANLNNKNTDTFINPTENGYEYLTDLNVSGIENLTRTKTTLNLTSSAGLSVENLKATPELKESVKSKYSNIMTPVQKVNAEVAETQEGLMLRFSGTGNNYPDFNPAVMAAPVAAQTGGYAVQLNSYDQAFQNMDTYMLMPYKERQAMKNRNKVAATSGNAIAFDPTMTHDEHAAGWFRPYTSFEKIGLKNGPKVENNMYGSYFGGESEMKDLGHGVDAKWGAYVGYNGAHQNYDGVGIYENGGTIGLTGMVYKDNFFAGATVNGGLMGAEASTKYGNETFGMVNAGASIKTGYNAELADGKFIIQPNVQTSYSFVDTFNYHNAADVAVSSDALHAITVQPGVKFIGNLPHGWQPYADASVVMNFMDKTHFTANDTTLPSLSIKPYAKYGFGVRKMWGDRMSGNLQCYMMNGGRNGFGIQGGFKWAIGKDGSSSSKTSSKTSSNYSAGHTIATPNAPEQKNTTYNLSSQNSLKY